MAITVDVDGFELLVGGATIVGVALLLGYILRRRRRAMSGTAKTAAPRLRPAKPDDFGEPALARELEREERVTSRDMLRVHVPHEEAVVDLHGSPRRAGGHPRSPRDAGGGQTRSR